MSTILNFLSNDHRACDALFASAESAAAQKNWVDARALFDQFKTAMIHHLSMEETVLFPAFETRIGNTMGPTQIMRMEHEQIRGLVQSMADAVEARDMEGYLGLSETLNILMQQHNVKEETMLYPMSDKVLSGDQDGLIDAMKAVA